MPDLNIIGNVWKVFAFQMQYNTKSESLDGVKVEAENVLGFICKTLSVNAGSSF